MKRTSSDNRDDDDDDKENTDPPSDGQKTSSALFLKLKKRANPSSPTPPQLVICCKPMASTNHNAPPITAITATLCSQWNQSYVSASHLQVGQFLCRNCRRKIRSQLNKEEKTVPTLTPVVDEQRPSSETSFTDQPAVGSNMDEIINKRLSESIADYKRRALDTEITRCQHEITICNIPCTDVNESQQVTMARVENLIYEIMAVEEKVVMLNARRIETQRKKSDCLPPPSCPPPVSVIILRTEDKDVIKAKLGNLAAYNGSRTFEEQIQFDFDHFPPKLQKHKAVLQNKFTEANMNGLSPRWLVDYESEKLCLKIGKQIIKPN